MVGFQPLQLGAFPADLVVQGPVLSAGLARAGLQAGDPGFQARAGFGQGADGGFKQPDAGVPQPVAEDAVVEGVQQGALLAGCPVGRPGGGDGGEDLLLVLGPLGGAVRLVERGEHLAHPRGGGVGRRGVEHVVADEQVKVADVLQGLRLAQQGQRRLRVRAQAGVAGQHGRVLGLGPREAGGGRRVVPLQAGGGEPVLRPRFQCPQVEVAVVDQPQGLQVGAVGLGAREPADDRAGDRLAEPVVVGGGDRSPGGPAAAQVQGLRLAVLVVVLRPAAPHVVGHRPGGLLRSPGGQVGGGVELLQSPGQQRDGVGVQQLGLPGAGRAGEQHAPLVNRQVPVPGERPPVDDLQPGQPVLPAPDRRPGSRLRHPRPPPRRRRSRRLRGLGCRLRRAAGTGRSARRPARRIAPR